MSDPPTPSAANLRSEGEEKDVDEAAMLHLIDERDDTEKWADALAEGIAAHFQVDIGEHTSHNNPWSNALAIITLRDHV